MCVCVCVFVCLRACIISVGLHAHVFVYECVQFAQLYIFGCVHVYMCVCVLSHHRWSIAITGSPDIAIYENYIAVRGGP